MSIPLRLPASSIKMTDPINTDLNDKLKNLPDKPGVYQFFDTKKTILYIGKAKSLKKRVNSYFNRKSYDNKKLKVLVRKITDIQHIVVDSEADALLLENNLIKKYQPRYNINLKDDKTFPWIVIKNEAFPRVFSTRQLINDGSAYYGPYTSAITVRTLLGLIKELYPLRNCSLNLNPENIAKGKYRICLEYHLGNCKGPCENKQTEEDYKLSINQIHTILKGNLKEVISYLKLMMTSLASQYKFEEAGKIKQRIDTLEKFQLKSTVVNPAIRNLDVFSLIAEDDTAWINFIKVVNGAILQSHTLEVIRQLDEEPEDILAFTITELRYRFQSNATEALIPFKISSLPGYSRLTVPQKGDKMKLLELSLRNAKYFMLERKRQKNLQAGKTPADRILETIKKDLRLSEKPTHIECFDNSNIQGANPVAACVVFKNARPAKREYRHYNIKTVEGPNDFASMKEVVLRRYKRLLNENQPLPQLIIIDGGKGQLNAAMQSVEQLGLRSKIAIVGIAKRLEEIYFPDDPVPLYIDKNSESLKLIQNLRNEAHRFGITFHRLKRSESMIHSELENIPGIGEKSIQKLISHFKSINNLKHAELNEIEKILGKSSAQNVWKYFNN
jgi:excinuclease ABC subunit C